MAKEEEFAEELLALMQKYDISLVAWDQYGDEECQLGDEYLFESGSFRLEIDEIIKAQTAKKNKL